MSIKGFSIALLVGLVLLHVGMLWTYYPQLPDELAQHFGAGGQPNGWGSKDAVFAILGGAPILVIGLIAVASRARVSPKRVPHASYWLAPERREKTQGWYQKAMLVFATVFVGFLVAVSAMVLEANLVQPPRLSDDFVWVLGAFMTFVFAWTGALLLRFRRPRGD
jgi:uncharacterized membrane protein